MHWGVQCLTKGGTLFPRILCKRVLWSRRSSNVETGNNWLVGQGFPGEASRFYFLG